MELAARRFARWVLIIHVLLLVVVIGLVVTTAGTIYVDARQQTIEQASKVQMLLAEQIQHGIESYYSSVADTLNLLQGAEQSNQADDAVWDQIKNRASHFFIVTRATGAVSSVHPTSEVPTVQRIVERSGAWLGGVRDRTIGPSFKIGSEDSNLVCVPGSQGRRVFVAVVPVVNLDKQFFQGVHAERKMSAILLDDNMRIVNAFEKNLIGFSVLTDGPQSDDVRQLAQRYLEMGIAGTEIFEKPFQLGGYTFDRGMVSLRPVQVLGKRWWLSVGSDLSAVDAVVLNMFRSALRWAIFLVVSVTVILVSTSFQMIRSRMRLERVSHELLTRELSQAREIQLSWLPHNDNDPKHADLCAVNIPASHISGDFYNWFDLPDGRACVVIGDVTGHGMAAAFLMATTQLLVRMLMPRVLNAGRCMQEVNNQLCQQVFAGQFVTMQILILDRKRSTVEIATAGHPPPLLGSGREFIPVDLESQLVLGIEAKTEYRSQTFDLPEGAQIVLYSDGATDAQAPDGTRIHIEGLCQSLYGKFESAQALIDSIVAAVNTFRGPRELADDLTLVAIQLQPKENRLVPIPAASAAPSHAPQAGPLNAE